MYEKKIQVPTAVTRLYDALYRMQYANSLNELYELQADAESCFFASEESGLRLTVDGIGEMTSNLYIQTVSEQIYRDKDTYINYNIDDSEYAGSDSSFCITYVSKLLIEGDNTIPYRDILVTRVSDPGHIIDFTNRKLADIKNASQLFPSLNSDDLSRSSSERLIMWSEMYSAKGLYSEAEKCLSELQQRAPDDISIRKKIMTLRFKERQHQSEE